MKLKTLLFTCAAAIAMTFANATDIDPKSLAGKKSDLMGGVYDNTKKPLSNVNVTAYLSSKKEKVVTDINGFYSFDDLKPGNYKFVFEKEGYKKVSKEKSITRPDEALQLVVQMEEHSTFDFMPGPSHFFGSE